MKTIRTKNTNLHKIYTAPALERGKKTEAGKLANMKK